MFITNSNAVFMRSALCSLFLVLCPLALQSAPAKLATKTVAAKAAPAAKPAAKPAEAAKAAAKTAAPASAAAKAPAKAAAKAAQPAANAQKPAAAAAPKVESVVDKFAPQLKQKEPKKKKAVKMRKQVIDGKVCAWGRTAEDAELGAAEAVRKFVGKKSDFQIKDCVIAADGARFYCLLRFNYSDQIPETWYLETEMVAGFGNTYLRAFSNAISKAQARVKSIHSSADWKASNSSIKDASEMGFIPYDYVFATVNSQKYCKVFFRYLKQRQ